MSSVAVVLITQDHQNVVEVQQVKKCSCGPTEHWFYKACVKNYNKQFIDACLPENNDTEGLATNVLQAIELLAADMLFVDENGTLIIPALNAKGNLMLSMSKNNDYMLCKQILRDVDISTTLTAQELYYQWSQALKLMKSTQ